MRIFYRFLKSLSGITLFFFCWTYLSLWQVAAFAKEAQVAAPAKTINAVGKATPSSGDRLEATLEAIRESVSKAEEKAAKAQDSAMEIETVKAKKAEIDILDTELQKEFAATEQKLKEQNLPREILDRHAKFVKHYNDNLAELKANLTAIENAKTKAQLKAALQKSKSHLVKVKAPKKHVPLDPNKLPNRNVKAKERAPRLNKEDFEKEFGPQKKTFKLAGRETISRKNVQAEQKLRHELSRIGSKLSSHLMSPAPVQLAYNDIVSDVPLSLGTKASASLTSATVPFDPIFASLLTPDDSPMLIAQAMLDLPTSADLAETVDVQFTQEIKAKAQELGYNPVKIYAWIRNNIEFVPTYGSVQGAHMCLQTKQCNSFDTASLLIALLRTSNIPAKYVYGTIEVPAERVMNWAGGFTDPMAAATLMASGGIPIKPYSTGGKITKVQMEHAWVEAWVDYSPSRGAIHKQGDTWIALDGSYKRFTYKTGLNVAQIAGFDPNPFVDSLKADAIYDPSLGYISGIKTALIQTKYEEVKAALNTHINTLENPTIGDVIGAKDIIQEKKELLPASLPYKVILVGSRISEIPDALRHKVSIAISDSQDMSQSVNVSYALAYLAGKRITVAYMPATDSDAQILGANGYYRVKPYLVNLRPVLLINGSAAATGGSIGMGELQELSIAFNAPNGLYDSVRHTIPVATYASIGFDLQRIPKSLIEQGQSRLEAAKNQLGQQTVNVDDIIGETLNLHALGYFYQLEAASRMIATGKIAYVKQPAEMLATLTPSIGYLYGIAYSIADLTMGVDVRRYVMSAISLKGDSSEEKGFMITTGTTSSAYEHLIFEQLHQSGQGVSAIKILSIANEQSVPIYTIDSTNAATILPRLRVAPETLADINNSLAAGKRITVPERSIQYYDWTGDGYIVMDVDTGSAAYMISGGLAGGGTAQEADILGVSFDTLLTAFSFLMDAGGAVIDLTKYLSKVVPQGATKILNAVGYLLGIVSAFKSGYDMYEKTNCQWKAGAAAGTDFLLSMLAGAAISAIIGMIVAATIFAAFIIAVVVVLVVSIVFYLLSLLLQYLIEIIPYCLNMFKRYYVLAKRPYMHQVEFTNLTTPAVLQIAV